MRANRWRAIGAAAREPVSPSAHGADSVVTPQWGQSTRQVAHSSSTARPHASRCARPRVVEASVFVSVTPATCRGILTVNDARTPCRRREP
jgi:hypothetical protein